MTELVIKHDKSVAVFIVFLNDLNRDSAIRLTVGTIAKGPINLRRKSRRPLKPMTTSNNAEMAIAP